MTLIWQLFDAGLCKYPLPRPYHQVWPYQRCNHRLQLKLNEEFSLRVRIRAFIGTLWTVYLWISTSCGLTKNFTSKNIWDKLWATVLLRFLTWFSFRISIWHIWKRPFSFMARCHLSLQQFLWKKWVYWFQLAQWLSLSWHHRYFWSQPWSYPFWPVFPHSVKDSNDRPCTFFQTNPWLLHQSTWSFQQESR